MKYKLIILLIILLINCNKNEVRISIHIDEFDKSIPLEVWQNLKDVYIDSNESNIIRIEKLDSIDIYKFTKSDYFGNIVAQGLYKHDETVISDSAVTVDYKTGEIKREKIYYCIPRKVGEWKYSPPRSSDSVTASDE